MKTRPHASLLAIAVTTLTAISFVVEPASAKEKEKTGKHPPHAATTSAAAAASLLGSMPEQSVSKPGQYDSKPGVAWKTVGGTVKDIQGDTYTVEDYEGSQMKMRVGQGTKHLRGNKKVGDTIRAEITHGGFANSIQ